VRRRNVTATVVFCGWSALAASQPGVSQPAVLESAASARDLPLTTDPNDEVWAKAPRVQASRNRTGDPVPGPPTEIRSRWTKEHLYLLFICPYEKLNIKTDPTRTEETPRLWTWDVAEAFIGSDFGQIWRYKEFQVSPQGEWVDLDIDRHDPRGQQGQRWNSGFSVTARIDAEARTWYGVMRIPFSAIDTRTPQEGRELRLGLFRLQGPGDPRTAYVWQPTGQSTFHVPEVFGILRLR
jgi:hypothetical protein